MAETARPRRRDNCSFRRRGGGMPGPPAAPEPPPGSAPPSPTILPWRGRTEAEPAEAGLGAPDARTAGQQADLSEGEPEHAVLKALQ